MAACRLGGKVGADMSARESSFINQADFKAAECRHLTSHVATPSSKFRDILRNRKKIELCAMPTF